MDDERCNYARGIQRFCGCGHYLYSGKFVAHGAMADSKLCGCHLRLGFRVTKIHADERWNTDKPGFPPDNGQDGDVFLFCLHGVHD